MFTYNINPVLLNLGPLEIRYYGLLYVINAILAYFILKNLSKKGFVKITAEKIEDLLAYAVISGVIGARLFYILFYNFKFYLQNPFEVIAVWHGGLSFHGGLFGALIGVYYFSRKFNYKFLQLIDVMSIPLALAAGIGRLGNFINGELIGRVTDVSWCFDFGDKLCRHPSQLYESLYSFFIFFLLWKLKDKKMKTGVLFSLFVMLYSSLRFLTEFFRQPDSQIGFIFGLTLGQWLNMVMFVIGFFFYKTNKDIKGNK
ncbi:MAG: prolipoprotein diacylglyceryl transferase [Nanoarchaeota archaeon]